MSDASSTTQIEKASDNIAIPGYCITPTTLAYPITMLTSRRIQHSIDRSVIGFRLPTNADLNRNMEWETLQ